MGTQKTYLHKTPKQVVGYIARTSTEERRKELLALIDASVESRTDKTTADGRITLAAQRLDDGYLNVHITFTAAKPAVETPIARTQAAPEAPKTPEADPEAEEEQKTEEEQEPDPPAHEDSAPAEQMPETEEEPVATPAKNVLDKQRAATKIIVATARKLGIKTNIIEYPKSGPLITLTYGRQILINLDQICILPEPHNSACTHGKFKYKQKQYAMDISVGPNNSFELTVHLLGGPYKDHEIQYRDGTWTYRVGYGDGETLSGISRFMPAFEALRAAVKAAACTPGKTAS